MTEIAPRIVVDEHIRFGKPVIKGTRVPVAQVVRHLAAGDSMNTLMEEYNLSEEDVRAALAYAASVLDNEEIRVTT